MSCGALPARLGSGIVSAHARVWLFLRGASPRRVRCNRSLVPSPAMMYGSKTTREEWYGALANAIVEAWTGNVPGRKGGRVSLKQSSLVTEQSKAGGDPVNDGGSRNKPAVKVRLSRACRRPRAWHGTREDVTGRIKSGHKRAELTGQPIYCNFSTFHGHCFSKLNSVNQLRAEFGNRMFTCAK